MAPLSTVVSKPDRARVCALARRVAGAGADRGGGHPVWRRVCLQVAAIAPDLPVPRLTLLARYATWCYQLDDRMDAPDADPADLRALRDGVVGVLTGAGPASERDPLPLRLRTIYCELSGYDDGGAVTGRFAAALRDAVTLDLDHVLLARAVAAGTRPPPPVADYLSVAARTVNYHSFVWALLAVGIGRLSPAQLLAVAPALDLAATAVRLGNDLRGADRDGSELNVLQLPGPDGVRLTRAEVRERIDELVAAHDRLLDERVAAGRVRCSVARTLRRCLAQSVRLYRYADLR